ncbi:hypothetical protein KY329_03100 [Candidatus Woesearchaeota archaeon]|nr:hypothetical protein [Candidatus Woesearchaeota archaeon]
MDLYLALGIYVILLLVISYLVSRKQTSEDFLISGRDRSSWQILLSKFATSVGAGWFLTYTAYSYEFGIGVITIVVGAIIGYPLYACWAAPRVYKDSREQQFYTQGDYVYHNTKSKAAKWLTNGVSIFMQSLWLLVGIVGGAKVVSNFGLLSYEAAVIVTSAIVLTYLLLAGYKAVILTDVFQAGIILILLTFISYMLIKGTSIMTVLREQTTNIQLGAAAGFFLYGLLAVFATSDRIQLSYAAKNTKSLKRGMMWAVIPIVLTTILLLLIGLFVHMQNANLDPGIVFIKALENYLPASLLPIGVVLFFAGLMSTADTVIYAIVSHFVFSLKFKNPVKSIRIGMMLLVVIATIVALVFKDIIDITVLAGGATLLLSVPMIYLIAGKHNAGRYIGSTIGSIIGLIAGIIVFGMTPTVALPILIGACLGLLFRTTFKYPQI